MTLNFIFCTLRVWEIVDWRQSDLQLHFSTSGRIPTLGGWHNVEGVGERIDIILAMKCLWMWKSAFKLKCNRLYSQPA